MNHRLDLTPSLFALTVVLATVIHFPVLRCQKTHPYNICRQSVKCGNIQLEYPFWGSDRPAYCGHPGFQLTCQSNVPKLVYKSVNYRVLDIDSSTQTITIARNDLWTNDCPEYLHNTTYNSTLFNGDNFDQQNISLYYKCDTNIPGGISVPTGHRFSCNVNNTQSDSYFYLTNLIRPNIANFFVLCDSYITVPVNQSSAARLATSGASRSDLSSALTAGFNLQWTANNDECEQCIQSDGQCGSNSTSPDLFACYCTGGNFSLTCNNVGESGSNFLVC
ncbi:putative wall-associated receptor kinase, galacturonan-binding domain-containing protein [Helianthus anomalus]